VDVREYFEFKGIKYGIGTVVKVPLSTDLRWTTPGSHTYEAKFVGGGRFAFTHLQGGISLYESRGHFSGKYEEYIEIVKPVYYQEPEPPRPQNMFFRTKSGTWDAHNEVCIGFIWYIAIMLLAVIFKDKIGIWIFATIVYFLWKANK
jgi:hypothetical protein